MPVVQYPPRSALRRIHCFRSKSRNELKILFSSEWDGVGYNGCFMAFRNHRTKPMERLFGIAAGESVASKYCREQTAGTGRDGEEPGVGVSRW